MAIHEIAICCSASAIIVSVLMNVWDRLELMWARHFRRSFCQMIHDD